MKAVTKHILIAQPTMPLISLSHQDAHIKIRRWIRSSVPFSVNIYLADDGAKVFLRGENCRFQLSDGTGKGKVMKSIGSLKQWLEKILPSTHSDCIKVEISPFLER